MITKQILRLYSVMKDRGWRGRGILLRSSGKFLPGMREFHPKLPGLNNPTIDLGQSASLAYLDLTLGDAGHSTELIKYMEYFLEPGGWLWDIGANVGVVSSHFANPQFQLGGIVAFEPNPAIGKILSGLFRETPLVTLCRFGLGDQETRASLYVPPNSSSMASLVPANAGTVAKAVEVPIQVGDTFWRNSNLPGPAVIKIDVEGFEPAVFRGIESMITTCQPVIFFEHIMMSDSEITDAQPSGYELRFIADNGEIFNEISQRLRGHDAIFIPQQMISKLPDSRSE